MSSLPTPRQLLTSLFSTLSYMSNLPPNQSNPATQTVNLPYDQPSDPLNALPTSHRALLTTLHVLLPTGVVLQALDLLDRRLVIRFVEGLDGEGRVMPPKALIHSAKSSGQAEVEAPQTQIQAQEHEHQMTDSTKAGERLQDRQAPKSSQNSTKNVIYQVRSSQASRSRFKEPASIIGGSLIYTVRLQAWNCSCAAFAFEAFPGSVQASPWLSLENGDSDQEVKGGEDKDDMDCGFGSLSFDGKDGAEGRKVPICKHLLACLLLEQWGLLEIYVEERHVGREVMAGVGGEG